MTKDRQVSAGHVYETAETVLKQAKQALLDAPLPEPLEKLLAEHQKTISRKQL